MVGLGQLQSVVWMSNLAGLVPVRMRADGGRLCRFIYSLRHPITVWCFLIYIGQLYLMISWLKMVYGIWFRSERKSLGTAALCLSQLNKALFVFASVPFVCKCRRLAQGCQLIQKFDDSIQHLFYESWSVGKRFFVCIVLFSLQWTVSQLVKVSTMQSPIYLDVIYQLSQLKIYTVYIIFHLSYYTIAHRIAMLTFLLDNIDDCRLEKKNDDNEGLQDNLYNKLIMVHRLFECLCQVADHLRALFSLTAAVVVTAKTVSFITNMFLLMNSSRFLTVAMVLYTIINNMTFSVLEVFIILKSADLPKSQLIQFRNRLQIMLTATMEETRTKFQVMSMLMQSTEDRFQLSAAGLFKVGMHLVPSMIATILTYSLVIWQLN